MAQSCFLYKSSSFIFGDYKLVQTECKNNDNNNKTTGAPNEDIVQNHLHMALLDVV